MASRRIPIPVVTHAASFSNVFVVSHEAATLAQMRNSDVFLSGLGGLGVEIAKNVLMNDVRSLTLHDASVCTGMDLSSQYCLSQEALGRNRAEACIQELAALNGNVKTTVYKGALSAEFLQMFKVVVLTNSSFEEQLRISEITHANNIGLVIADTRGLFGQIFCDFGPEFLVIDVDGDNLITTTISNITNAAEGVVTCCSDADRGHGLNTGDFVTFTDVCGMEELNGCEPTKIKVLTRFSFTIGDTSHYSKYTEGGIVIPIKMQKFIQFMKYSDSLAQPEYIITDHAKSENSSQLHLAFQTLHRFNRETCRLPKPWNEDDAQAFLLLAEEVQKNSGDEINTELFKLFSKVCSGNFCPVNSIIGGIAAQEVFKACTGKFTPLFQWLYFDAMECLPENVAIDDCIPMGCRTDGQTVIFGRIFQNKLDSLKVFLAGAGSTGCEILKILAMMGVSAGKGQITVTDMERIERSNLRNRHVLFRTQHVGQSKASVAARVIKHMNPAINIEAQDNRIGTDTESIYDDYFFENVDVLTNAIDNIDTRLYMDSRCVFYRKPLIETGTSCTKGSVQVIVPFLTELYSSSIDPPDRNIPICTMRNFPYLIEHTLLWATDIFESLFQIPSEKALGYLKNANFIETTMKLLGNEPFKVLECLTKTLVDDRPLSIINCVEWARKQFEELFCNQIKQLLHNYPSGTLTSSGQPFWSGTKRCPTPLEFDFGNQLHLDFIFTAANLRAEMYGIPQIINQKDIETLIYKAAIPDFRPKSNLKISVIDSHIGVAFASSKIHICNSGMDRLIKDLPTRDKFKDLQIKHMVFDKDEDIHVNFLVAASNLRASNYKIPPADRFMSKLITLRTVPSIQTTKSVVAGLACLELVKLVISDSRLEFFKNGYFNLAVPLFSFSEPVKAPVQSYNGLEWTLWDRFDIQGEMNLLNFLIYFEKKFSLEITMIAYGDIILYSSIFHKNTDLFKQHQDLLMSELVEIISKVKLQPEIRVLVFDICCNDSKGNDVEVPYVKYTLPTQALKRDG